MNKFTLKNMQCGWCSKDRQMKKIEHKLGFSISSTSVDAFNSPLDGISSSKINKGDEVVVNFNTGSAFNGWFIGKGKTTKYVCIIWIPSKDYFRIVDVIDIPIKADWTKYHTADSVSQVKDKMEDYRLSTSSQYIMDLLS